MKHIASLREGDVVRYALVDEETGELVQFAQLSVPDHFDFEQSALLGTNLASVLGLDRNGTRPKPKPIAAPPPADVDAPVRKPGRPKGGNAPGRYTITLNMIRGVLREHDPEKQGMTAGQIASYLGKESDRAWVVKSISNRYGSERTRVQRGEQSPLDWRIEQGNGKMTRAYLIWVGD